MLVGKVLRMICGMYSIKYFISYIDFDLKLQLFKKVILGYLCPILIKNASNCKNEHQQSSLPQINHQNIVIVVKE